MLVVVVAGCGVLSPPTRGRGLKRVTYVINTIKRRVAPHAGAWIET